MTAPAPLIDHEAVDMFFRPPGQMGRWRTASLFEETCTPADKPIFTLGERDVPSKGLISLKKRYLEVGDPTEYEFARTCLGGWDHWRALCSSPSLSKHIKSWRTELRARLASQSYRIIREAQMGSGPTKSEVDAARWVYSDLLSDNQIATKLAPLHSSEMDDVPLAKALGKRGRPSNRPPSPGVSDEKGLWEKALREDWERMSGGQSGAA